MTSTLLFQLELPEVHLATSRIYWRRVFCGDLPTVLQMRSSLLAKRYPADSLRLTVNTLHSARQAEAVRS